MFGFAKGKANEDSLTAAVFGLMHYLSDREFLYPFLTRVSARNPGFEWNDAQPPDEAEVVPWPTLDVPPGMGARFAPAEGGAKGRLVPDVLVSLQWRRWGIDRRERRASIYVEAEHSKVVEAEQLAQQWAVVGTEATEWHEVWLLLLNGSPSLPWPERSRPRAWPDGPALADRDLVRWCAHRVHFLRTGERRADPDQLPPAASPRLIHFSWQRCADLTAQLERRSWAYGGLFAGLRAWLTSAGYGPSVGWLEVVEVAPATVLPDRLAAVAGRRPEVISTDPDALFARVGDNWFAGVVP